MARNKKRKGISLSIYLPEPTTILVAVLSFLIGFLYRKYNDNESIKDSFDEGFNKGEQNVIKSLAQLTRGEQEIELFRSKVDR